METRLVQLGLVEPMSGLALALMECGAGAVPGVHLPGMMTLVVLGLRSTYMCACTAGNASITYGTYLEVDAKLFSVVVARSRRAEGPSTHLQRAEWIHFNQ